MKVAAAIIEDGTLAPLGIQAFALGGRVVSVGLVTGVTNTDPGIHSATPTNTPSRTPTATPSPTPLPVVGDVNCDGYRTAADVVALVTLLPASDFGECGAADVNRDGVVDTDDMGALMERIFGEP